MMNLVSLALVLTSILSAQVLSENQKEDGILKEGHGNTEVSISPENNQQDEGLGDFLKDRVKEASRVLPKLGQGVSCEEGVPDGNKIAKALGKTKDKVAEVANESGREVKEAASRKAHEAKETFEEKAHEVKESAKTVKDTSKTIVKDVESNVSEQWETAQKAKERSDETKKRVSAYFRDAASLVNLLGFAVAYGTCVWVTFVSSYALATAMPRQQFAVVQSKVYPVYFRAMAYSVGAALVGHLFGHGTRLFHSKAGIFQAYNLFLSIFLVLVNAVYLEPITTKSSFSIIVLSHMVLRFGFLMRRRLQSSYHLRGEGRYHTVGGRGLYGWLNSFSSLLNILALMALTWHLVYLAQRLRVTC